MSAQRFIHLLYVPTMACNMACRYCYLEDNTKDEFAKFNALSTLKYAIDKFAQKQIIPFNISLHGGEVTTLSKEDFHDLIQYISDYYNKNRQLLNDNGFKVGKPHIKTNLFDLGRHFETIKEFNVSISGSLDLPLSLHDEYRITKGAQKTLDTILKNVEMLKDLPNKKKVSATIFKEHFDRLDEIVEDIRYLHRNTCLDMNDFNFMIGFDYNSNGILHHISEEEQLILYNRMHQEFDGSDLDEGVNGSWFDEFGPGYCSNCDNCGDKFFLLEKNGDIYSCVRGQKNPNYYYGNIYKDSVDDILKNAHNRIFENHNRQPFDEKCTQCRYLYLCKTGCPFVKNVYNSSTSYTCLLQQQMYKDRNYGKDIDNDEFVYNYVRNNRKEDCEKYYPKTVGGIPTLQQMIAQDEKLKYIYDSECFILKADGNEYQLSSQIIKTTRSIIYLSKASAVQIYCSNTLLKQQCDYPQNNALYMMLLSGNLITYGDEQRTKQAHLASKQVYEGVLKNRPSDKKGYFCYDISDFIKEYAVDYSTEKPNNLFFTTTALRDYHYTKQKQNAYYHIQAINLPFQNIEFYYFDKEFEND